MTTTYTWTVDSLECTANTGFECTIIKSAPWTLTGTDGSNTTFIQGNAPINMTMVELEGHPEGDRFAALTEAEVITAIQTQLGTAIVTELETHIDNELYVKTLETPPVIPKIVTPALPWVV